MRNECVQLPPDVLEYADAFVHRRIELPLVAFGAHYAGLYYTFASTRLTPGELAYIVEDSGAKVVVLSDTIAAALQDELRAAGDSIGARIDVVASNVPVGWGEPVYDKLDADLAYNMMSINAVKGVEIGAGFRAVEQKGTEHSDEMTPQGFVGNNNGGILGGISTGQEISVSIALKPTSSIRLPRRCCHDQRGEFVRSEGAETGRQLARGSDALRRILDESCLRDRIDRAVFLARQRRCGWIEPGAASTWPRAISSLRGRSSRSSSTPSSSTSSSATAASRSRMPRSASTASSRLPSPVGHARSVFAWRLARLVPA